MTADGGVMQKPAAGIPDKLKGNSRPGAGFWYVRNPGGHSWTNHGIYLEMRLKIEAVFEHYYAAQSEYYKRANIVQRFAMEDAFYRLTMESLGKIIGPFEM